MGNSPLASDPVAAREPDNTHTGTATLSDSEDESSYQEIITDLPQEPPAGAGQGGENVINGAHLRGQSGAASPSTGVLAQSLVRGEPADDSGIGVDSLRQAGAHFVHDTTWMTLLFSSRRLRSRRSRLLQSRPGSPI
jgi:hypothetical protein